MLMAMPGNHHSTQPIYSSHQYLHTSNNITPPRTDVQPPYRQTSYHVPSSSSSSVMNRVGSGNEYCTSSHMAHTRSSISPNQEDVRLPPITTLLTEPPHANQYIPPSLNSPSSSSQHDLHASMMHQVFNTPSKYSNNCNVKHDSSPFTPGSSSQNQHPLPYHHSLDDMYAKSASINTSYMNVTRKHEANHVVDTCTVPTQTCQKASSSTHPSQMMYQNVGREISHVKPSTSDMNVSDVSLKRKYDPVNTNSSTSSNETEENAFNPERTRTACSVCRIAKKKCDGKDPCSRCLRLGKECKFTNSGKARGRPKKASTEITSNQLQFHNAFEEQPKSKKTKSNNE